MLLMVELFIIFSRIDVSGVGDGQSFVFERLRLSLYCFVCFVVSGGARGAVLLHMLVVMASSPQFRCSCLFQPLRASSFSVL